MRLAAQMHCSLAELGERITAEEFGLWLVYMEEEPSGPLANLAMLGELLCALANGPLKPPRGRKSWSPSDFTEKRWRSPETSPAPPSEPTLEQLQKFFGG